MTGVTNGAEMSRQITLSNCEVRPYKQAPLTSYHGPLLSMQPSECNGFLKLRRVISGSYKSGCGKQTISGSTRVTAKPGSRVKPAGTITLSGVFCCADFCFVATELKDPICHSDECQIGSFSSEATISPCLNNVNL